MIDSYIKLKFYIYADNIMCGFDKVSFIKQLFHPNIRKDFLRTLRITEFLNNQKWKYKWMWIPYFFYSRKLETLRYKCGYSIPLNVLGYGTNVCQIGSCVINGASPIGNYCALMNNVTIADANPKKIGDGVYFATNVVVAGKTNIKSGCKISANSFVRKTIDKQGLYVGCPAQYKKDCDPWYLEKGIYERVLRCEKKRLLLGIYPDVPNILDAN